MKKLLMLAAIAVAYWVATRSDEPTSPVAASSPETYRLVHAIGNSENISARNLSKADCEARKKDLKAVATSLGTYNEATGYGSITCLPEGM